MLLGEEAAVGGGEAAVPHSHRPLAGEVCRGRGAGTRILNTSHLIHLKFLVIYSVVILMKSCDSPSTSILCFDFAFCILSFQKSFIYGFFIGRDKPFSLPNLKDVIRIFIERCLHPTGLN